MRAMTIGMLLGLAGGGAMVAEAAEPMGLQGEKVLEVQGKVVDVHCSLTGDCPPDCGGGKRQLGLLTADNKLIVAVKGPVLFAGAVQDLLPHCGRAVQADGLLITHPDIAMYLVQAVRTDAGQDWKPAEAFATNWTAKHGQADEWQRADPLVKAEIAEKGKLGVPGLQP